MMNELAKLAQHLMTETVKTVNTSIPATVISFDPETGLAQCQIMIKTIDVQGNEHVAPPICEVHVVQYGDKDFFVETQIETGSEGILFFSQRCFDDWRDTGQISSQSVIRFHDISDAYFLAGMRSIPNKITGHANNGIKLRNKENTNFIWLKSDGTAEITVNELKLNGKLTHVGDTVHQGNTEQTGDIKLTGNIEASGSIQAPSIVVDGKELAGHKHEAGQLVGNQGAPVTGTTGENL